MTVQDFCEMCYDHTILHIDVWSNRKEKVVFSGFYDCDVMPQDILVAEVNSFDLPTKADHITLNID